MSPRLECWKREFTFEPRNITVDASLTPVITDVVLDKPIAVIRVDVRDPFGRAIPQYALYVYTGAAEPLFFPDPPRLFAVTDEQLTIKVRPRFLPLEQSAEPPPVERAVRVVSGKLNLIEFTIPEE